VTGSATVGGYTATATPGGQTCSTVPAADGTVPTTCVLTGLTPGTTYSIVVTVDLTSPRGKCQNGCPTTVGATATYWDPVRPASVKATAGTTTGSGVVVTWTAPATPSDIDHYLVTASSGTTTVGSGCTVATGDPLTCPFTSDLVTGTSYTFTVQALPSFTQSGIDPGLSSASIKLAAP